MRAANYPTFRASGLPSPPTSVHHARQHTLKNGSIAQAQVGHDPSRSIEAGGHLPRLTFLRGKGLPRWPSKCVLACGLDAQGRALSHARESQRNGGSRCGRRDVTATSKAAVHRLLPRVQDEPCQLHVTSSRLHHAVASTARQKPTTDLPSCPTLSGCRPSSPLRSLVREERGFPRHPPDWPPPPGLPRLHTRRGMPLAL